MIQEWPWSPIADDETFARWNFTALPWRQWFENAQHYGATRGRIVVSERYLDVAVPTGALAEMVRFVFDSTPLENAFAVRCIFGADTRQRNFGQVLVGWRVDTEDTAAANARTGPDTDQIDIRTGPIAHGVEDPDAMARGTVPIR